MSILRGIGASVGGFAPEGGTRDCFPAASAGDDSVPVGDCRDSVIFSRHVGVRLGVVHDKDFVPDCFERTLMRWCARNYFLVSVRCIPTVLSAAATFSMPAPPILLHECFYHAEQEVSGAHVGSETGLLAGTALDQIYMNLKRFFVAGEQINRVHTYLRHTPNAGEVIHHGLTVRPTLRTAPPHEETLEELPRPLYRRNCLSVHAGDQWDIPTEKEKQLRKQLYIIVCVHNEPCGVLWRVPISFRPASVLFRSQIQ